MKSSVSTDCGDACSILVDATFGDSAQVAANFAGRIVVLVSGASGAGKSALAGLLAARPGWSGVSEDLAWDHTGFAHDRGDPLAGEGLCRHQATREVVKEWVTTQLRQGKDVVVDFLMYQDPPLPLFDYEEHFKALGVRVEVVILRPDLDAVIQRDMSRGRPVLGNVEAMAFQHRCYHSPLLDGYRIIDTTHITAEETYERFVKAKIEG